MNSYSDVRSPRTLTATLLALTFAFAAATCARAQTPEPTPAEPQVAPAQPPSTEPQAADAPAGASASAETEAAQKRLTRARALAAIGKLAAAASELDALRSSSKDESVRDVARILLMAIFVEMPDYARATSLLDEAFNARTQGQTADAATHSYFALAGQTVNSVRTHLERYRSFGINVSAASDLPPDANGDLEQLRNLLERLSAQAKSLHDEQLKGGDAGTRGLDAAAFLEDAATVRMRIARNEQDRAQWQSVVSDARRHLFASEMRIASISEIPTTPAPVAAQPAVKTSASAAQPKSSASARGEQKPSGSQQKSSKKSGQQEKAGSSANAASAAPVATSGAQTPAQPSGESKAAAAGGGPVAVGSLASKARQKVSPTYPAIARAARVTGVVTVYVVVNERGEVEAVQRLEGPQQLQQAAAEAARRWRFNPTVIDGQAVRVSGYLSFNFSL